MHSAQQNRDPEAHKLADAASYDPVADDFDRFAERFSTPAAARMVELAGVRGGARVLDVGCGTGVLTRLVARQVGDRGLVVGLDLSDGMLREARARATSAGLERRIEFERGDAEQLEFPAASFDAVFSLYALLHFPHPERALGAMLRVSRPGSPTVVAVGSAPPLLSLGFPIRGCRLVRERALAFFGRGSLYAPAFLEGLLDRHLGHVPEDEEAQCSRGHGHGAPSVARMMRSVGYVGVYQRWIGQSSVIESADDFWKLQVTLSSRVRKRIGHAPERQVSSLRQEHDETCRRHIDRGGRLLYRSGCRITVATRPASP